MEEVLIGEADAVFKFTPGRASRRTAPLGVKNGVDWYSKNGHAATIFDVVAEVRF
jgi:hypothetical protein